MAKAFVDLAGPNGFEEDERITTIGRTVMLQGQRVAVTVDTEPGDAKAHRYRKKLRERFAGIVLGPIEQMTKHITFFTAEPPPHKAN